ncbi:hypothetical protein MtrunA17_Chr4g0031121 [Medicago truncatula]|uniref:Uncharacterized protein n=1 Tax=Medicago truncatula TaxID=3880 RepID=A0A396IDM4_MEDTR|nr:hypothetical protein MtrunA17_Chr4g0031121 [Medicago truncatula]
MTLAYLYTQLLEVGSIVGYMSLLKAWAVEHLKKLYVWKVNPEYDRRDSRAGRFKLSRGNADPAHYRSLIDLTVNDDIIWRPYEDT